MISMNTICSDESQERYPFPQPAPNHIDLVSYSPVFAIQFGTEGSRGTSLSVEEEGKGGTHTHSAKAALSPSAAVCVDKFEITQEAIDLMLSESAGGSAQSYGIMEFGPSDMEQPMPGTVDTGQGSSRTAGEYEGRAGMFLLGTGPSTSIPQIEHVFSTVISPEEPGTKKCKNCWAAWSDPTHPNNCDNICVVVAIPEPESDEDKLPAQSSILDDTNRPQVASPSGELPPSGRASAKSRKRRKHILVDMGKTFRQSMLKWMPKFGITQIDAVLLSHEHQDAFGGLDELRCLQSFAAAPGAKHQAAMYRYAAQARIPVILSDKCMEAVERVYSYIVEASRSKGPLDRKVAVVDFMPQRIPEEVEPMKDEVDALRIPCTGLSRLKITKLPVFHGGDLISLGYAFGRGYESIVYISDVSWISDRTMALVDALVPFKVLVIDSLYDSHPHFSHLCLYEAYDLIDRWRPAHTYIVGMGCMIDRCRMNKHLKDVVLPNLRSDTYQPYEFSCVGSGQPETFRPLCARARLRQMPPVQNRPPAEHIESIQLAVDGTFIPVDFQLDGVP